MPTDASGDLSRAALRTALTAVGTAATIAGARGLVRGAREVLDAGEFSANVDSEYRFYAAWYHVMGVMLLQAAPRPETATPVVRAVGAGFFAAATGRLLSRLTVGRPHRAQRFLMAVEFALPVVLVPWQAKVAARHERP